MLPNSFKWYQALFGQPETFPAHDDFGQPVCFLADPDYNTSRACEVAVSVAVAELELVRRTYRMSIESDMLSE